MADISITAANVVYSSGTKLTGTAGAAITAGQLVYLEAASQTYKLAQGNAAATNNPAGIALNNCSANQPIIVQSTGTLNIGATLTVGQTYVMSAANPGGIAPVSDLTTGNYVAVVGVAVTANNIQMSNAGIISTQIAHA